MPGERDEFPTKVNEVLAKRAAQRCSNPTCGVVTSGPHEDEDKAINVGVAAHITAASPGGPRYNQYLTPEERRSIGNAIWLCQNCAKRIDSDVKTYTEEVIRIWKRRHEEAMKAEAAGIVTSRGRAPALLNVSAISPNPSADNKSCILDFRVSNDGASDLLINAVEFEVLESIEKMLLGSAMYSAQYDLDITALRECSSRAACQVAQLLKPGEADRFAIVLSAPGRNTTIGGWRFATLFKTNVGDVRGPDTEVWIPGPPLKRFDELVQIIAEQGKASMPSGAKPAALLPSDLNENQAFERVKQAGGGYLSQASKASGYVTYIFKGFFIGWYFGPKPLAER